MRRIALFLSLFAASYGFAQSLPINFEGDIATEDFVDFDGGTATVLSNPFPSETNNSSSVARIIREGDVPFAGSKIILTDNLDFSEFTKITMKVYTTAPVGTVVKLKLEGDAPSADRDAVTTVSGEWEILEWIFLGTPNNLNELVFMFDFGNLGDGSETSTFYFDDVEQVEGPTAPVPASLPLNFEEGTVSTDFLNFAGAITTVIPNPEINAQNESATVGQIVRDGGQFFAGSKLFLTENLDLNALSQISIKIFTTAPVGTRVKLELESLSNGTTSRDYLTTVSGEWETATWNFNGQPGDYDRIQFLFDFGNVGDGTASSTFLFDDIIQEVGATIPDPVPTSLPIDFESGFVTTDFINENGGIGATIPNPQIDENNPSETVGQFIRSGGQPWAKTKLTLTDFIQDMSTNGVISMKVYTEAPVGTLLKFKIESNVAGFADERDAFTTVSGEWATYTWDFTNGDNPIYNVISLMLGYATPNDASENATFLFDDIEQLPTLSNGPDQTFSISEVTSYPNPAKDVLTIRSENTIIETITIFDILGKQVKVLYPNSLSQTIDVSNFGSGMYVAQVAAASGTVHMKLIIN